MRKYVSFFAVVVLVLGLNARQAQAQDPTRPVLQAGLNEVLADMHLVPVGGDWVMMSGTKALAEYRIKVQVPDPDEILIEKVDTGVFRAVEKVAHGVIFHSFNREPDGTIVPIDLQRAVTTRVMYICNDKDAGETCSSNLRSAISDGLVGVMPDFYGGEGDLLHLNVLYFPQLNK